jgi:hypothetical protein
MQTELSQDPRTGLDIIDIPPKHQKYFGDLSGAVIHWFGEVDKYNRMWTHQRRVAIFTDQCVYLCQLDGGITRCVNVRWINEIILTEKSAIGFKVGLPDYDMLISVDTTAAREAIVNIVTKVYASLVGTELTVRRLAGNSGVALQQQLVLAKPKEWSLKIEPVKSVKALTKLILDKQKREEEDRRVVEEEFNRIKEGLKQELKRYRTEEFERAVDQLGQYVKALEEKDREIQYLKETRVDENDPAVWRKCPNCAETKKLLDSNSNDDKQRIMRLERALEEQRHIVENLQTAIQYRSAAVKQTAEASGGETALSQALRTELADANRKNKELQQLIIESPFLTAEIKQRASAIAQHRDSGMGGSGGAAAASGTINSEAIAERDREIRHLKSLLRDATARHVQELEALRAQFKQYDNEIVRYLEKVFTSHGIAPPNGHTMESYAQATATAARQAAAPRGSMAAAASAPTPSLVRSYGQGSFDYHGLIPSAAGAGGAASPSPSRGRFELGGAMTPSTIARTPGSAPSVFNVDTRYDPLAASFAQQGLGSPSMRRY